MQSFVCTRIVSDDESVRHVASDFVVYGDDGRLDDRRVGGERRLDARRRQQMAGHVDEVCNRKRAFRGNKAAGHLTVDSAGHPKVAVGIASRAVASEVEAGKSSKVGLRVARMIVEDRPTDAGPRRLEALQRSCTRRPTLAASPSCPRLRPRFACRHCRGAPAARRKKAA